MKRIYFIDSENVGDSWLPLLAREDDDILVFYTSKSPYMSYDGLVMLKESPKEVTFIKCFEGTNALDFQLCSELGYRLNSEPADEYIIITNDTGYDAAVRYWQKKNYPVRRVQSKMVKTLLEPEKKPHADAAKKAEYAEKAEEAAASLVKAYAETAAAFAEQSQASDPEEEITPVSVPENEAVPEQTKTSRNRRSRRKNNARPAAERVEESIDARIAEAGKERLEEEKAESAKIAAEVPADTELMNAENVQKAENAQKAEKAESAAESADSEAPASRKLSRREQWRQRQQARKQKQKELAQAYAEKTAEMQPEETAEMQPEETAEAPAAIIRVENRSSGVQVIPPAFYTPKETVKTPETEAAAENAEAADVIGAAEVEEPAAVQAEEAPEAEEHAAVQAEKAPEVEEPAAVQAEEVTEEAPEAEEHPAEEIAAEEPAAEDMEAPAAVEPAEVVEIPAEAPEAATAEKIAAEESAAENIEAPAAEVPAENAETASEEALPAEEIAAEEPAVTEETEASATESAEIPEYPFDKHEVDTIINCIGKNNLGDIHNALELFYGEQGKEIYQTVKSASYIAVTKKWNRKQKFRKYCSVVFARGDWKSEEIPENFDSFLFEAEGKRKNLNSLRAALQSEYGKDMGIRLYSLFKVHIKILNRM